MKERAPVGFEALRKQAKRWLAALRAGDAEAYARLAKAFAASHGRRDAVAIMLALGMDPNRPGRHGHLPLHSACEDRAMVQLPLEHGADPRARVYGGTAASWARHAGNPEMAQLFAERTRDLLDAVLAGHLGLAHELLEEDPARVHERAPDGATALHLLPEDPDVAAPLVELLLAHGLDPHALDRDGRTPAARLEARGLDELADLLEPR